ncbi:hypothetical protein CXG81DRAFT_9421 [Caulochytrium protostelioides]|uniref:Carbon-nitrogen hydrolase n=1 Tax=Caulochytrium protostelioides TaxID=1555241 RepID=A0A4P9WXR6_9FUNG|nr:carbon-nitrogen hydrolase [Caulochytrium protostelioides]RKP03580.1 hypothetical protein CXG81DRAFT_9421 [Caulochytrium protostelioides]|eukprot:RKP03580.1 hypothetical protein CXG81DRAFT_9421 [Caulochytrium protostelioides]
MSAFRIALVQLKVGLDKERNLARAHRRVLEAARAGAQVVVLPECFNSPYGAHHFPQYAEQLATSRTAARLAAAAREANVTLIGGSFPERDDATGQLFNTCTVWSPEGERLGVHRKIHLFDIDVPGGIRFQESATLSPGARMTVVDTAVGRIGIGICYDIRFPELAMIAAREHHVVAMVYPGAFNMTTGPMHWELLARARAVDNQIWTALCSPARGQGAGYIAWGHSMLVDPNGDVVAEAQDHQGEQIVYGTVDPARTAAVRQAIPVTTQRRFDVYTGPKAVADNGV